MPKASKVGRFRAAAKASSREVKGAPLTSQYLAQEKRDGVAIVDGGDAANPLALPIPEEKETLSRGQRKRLAKREQYLKREQMVMSSLRLQRLEKQKGKLDGLDAIREALGEADAAPSKSIIAAAKEMMAKNKPSSADKNSNKLSCNTNKSKKTLANSEISHMGLVLQHPSFKEDPFAAIQQHLRNSLAPQAEKMKEDCEKRREEDDKTEAMKKEEKKERLRDVKFSKKGKKSGFKSGRAKRL